MVFTAYRWESHITFLYSPCSIPLLYLPYTEIEPQSAPESSETERQKDLKICMLYTPLEYCEHVSDGS